MVHGDVRKDSGKLTEVLHMLCISFSAPKYSSCMRAYQVLVILLE